MILLSNAGCSIRRGAKPSQMIAVGTVDGVALLGRRGNGWAHIPCPLNGVFVSALTRDAEGRLFAATHGAGVVRSDDDGQTWTWPNEGIDHFDFWSISSGRLGDRDVVIGGTLPAHVYLTDNGGDTWQELTAVRDVSTRKDWIFPPPPRIAHVKHIVIEPQRLLIGIEIGALLESRDGGRTFKDLVLDSDPRQCDVHRVLTDRTNPDHLVVMNGILGPSRSNDGGATWEPMTLPEGTHYPDAVVAHPDNPDLMFLTVGVGWPPHWYKTGRARGQIARSRDGGATWERLLGGLPNGQRAQYSAISMDVWDGGYGLYAADTDGQVFESLDEGETWEIIADVAPVSTGEFYRGLAKDKKIIPTVDDVVVTEVIARRFATADGA